MWAPSTRFEIKEFSVDSEGASRTVVIRTFRGMLRSVVSKGYLGKSRYEIETPTAVAGVRGTDFITVVSGPPLTTDVLAISGSVAVWNVDLELPDITLLKPGQMTTVTLGAPPSPARPIPEGFDMSVGSGGSTGGSGDGGDGGDDGGDGGGDGGDGGGRR